MSATEKGGLWLDSCWPKRLFSVPAVCTPCLNGMKAVTLCGPASDFINQSGAASSTWGAWDWPCACGEVSGYLIGAEVVRNFCMASAESKCFSSNSFIKHGTWGWDTKYQHLLWIQAMQNKEKHHFINVWEFSVMDLLQRTISFDCLNCFEILVWPTVSFQEWSATSDTTLGTGHTWMEIHSLLHTRTDYETGPWAQTNETPLVTTLALHLSIFGYLICCYCLKTSSGGK